MSKEQTFLIKYGIHNFVSCTNEGGRNMFLIRKSERETMIRHAQMLIVGSYGEETAIRLV